MVYELKIGNDNGNSEQDIVINGEMITQPNVYAKITILPNLEEKNPNFIAKNIHENLIVTIESNEVNNATPTTFYIGKYALKSGESLENIEVGVDNAKLFSDIPVVNTLANVAGYAVSKAYMEDSDVEEIEVVVNMTTALPVNQHTVSNAVSFTKRFMKGDHRVTVHLGAKKVKARIIFEYVKTLPEAVPTVFYLKSLVGYLQEYDMKVAKLDKKKDVKALEILAVEREKAESILKEYMKEYNINIDELSFDEKKILHVAIGEGTTEYPLTEDAEYNPNFIKGTHNGVGHAVERIIDRFRADKRLRPNFSRQNYSEALKNEMDKYHIDAVKYIQNELEAEARMILRTVKQEISKANNDIDCICVYGGGSILMKDNLYKPLKEFAKTVDIKVLYMPMPYSVQAEALGMYEFTTGPFFEILRNNYLEKRKNK